MTAARRWSPQKIARGNTYGVRVLKQVSVQFDEEMLAHIRALAVANGTSVTEQVRLLCEWGLETVRDSEGG